MGVFENLSDGVASILSWDCKVGWKVCRFNKQATDGLILRWDICYVGIHSG